MRVFAIETAVLIGIQGLDWPDRLSTQFSRIFGAIYFSVILVGLFLAIPLSLERALRRSGQEGLAKATVVAGVLFLALVTYVLFVVSAVWEYSGSCLPPGSLFDGNCELGPL